jgi:hypothetical protein
VGINYCVAVLTRQNVFLLPRPQSPPVRVHDIEHDWGLPSTHALNCVALGGYGWWYVYEHRETWQISTTFLVSLGVGILVRIFLPLGDVDF